MSANKEELEPLITTFQYDQNIAKITSWNKNAKHRLVSPASIPKRPSASASNTVDCVKTSGITIIVSILASIFANILLHGLPNISLWNIMDPWLEPFALDQNSRFLASYECRTAYSARFLRRDPLMLMLDDFLLPGEAEYMIRYAYVTFFHCI